MERSRIEEIVNCKYAKKYRVKLNDGSSKVVRLWKTDYGAIAIMNKGKRKWGRELSYYDIEKWVSIALVEHKGNDAYKLFMKRAKDAHTILSNSGLWKDIKEEIEHFLSLSEDEQREMVNDITTDSYERFYKRIWDGDKKYGWVSTYQVFESFASKRCWKSIAWRRWEREHLSKKVEEAINEGKHFSWRWTNGYDNSIDVDAKDDLKRGFYSEEYRHCGNGHYYLLFDATHAIFYEDD